MPYVSLAAALGIFLYLFRSALKPIFQDHTIANRVLIWRDGIQQFLQHPFIGCGIGTYHTTLSPSSPAFIYGINSAHNMYLHIAIEGGLCALITLVSLMGIYCYYLHKQIPKNVWLGMIICIYLVDGMFDFLLGHRSISMLLGITLGASLTRSDAGDAGLSQSF